MPLVSTYVYNDDKLVTFEIQSREVIAGVEGGKVSGMIRFLVFISCIYIRNFALNMFQQGDRFDLSD